MNNKIAIYLRLSLSDGDLKKGSKDESNSIENQRLLLHTESMLGLDSCAIIVCRCLQQWELPLCVIF